MPEPSFRAAQKLLKRFARSSGMQYKQIDAEYSELRVEFTNGRSQKVDCRIEGANGLAEEFVFESFIGPAVQDKYDQVLRANGRLDLGVIGVTEREGQEYFVVRWTELIEEADAQTVQRTAQSIAMIADEFEAKLTGSDRH